MRNIVLGFLTILMLAPSLACAMPSCTDDRLAQIERPPCMDHHSDHEISNDKKETGKVNFLFDCMGVDMQKTDTASIDKPDLKIDFVVYAVATDVTASHLIQADASTIRGPPPDWPSLFDTHPSLIQTTQRFRI